VGAVIGAGEFVQPLKPAGHPIELTRGGGDLPSRVADNLFWLGRYVERAENAVRLMRAIANRLSDRSVAGDVRELGDLMRALHNQGGTASGMKRDAYVESGDDLQMLLDESRRAGGLYDTLRSLQTVSRAVRDRISTDTWRIMNNLQEDAVWPAKLDATSIGEIIDRLNNMVTTLASFGGLASESMTRGQVWLFMDMGRRLERAVNMAGMLRTLLISPVRDDNPLLEAVLEIGDSIMTYRRRYLATLQMAPVLDLLLADETNPRSIAFQYVALNDHVEKLPRNKSLAHLTPEQRVTVGGLAALRLVDIDALCETDENNKRNNLSQLLKHIDEEMAALSDIVTRQYLSHALPARQLSSMRGDVV
jgi:uncharacterized alpha-E superfamily protein